VPDATVGERSHAFAHPDLTTFCRPDELGLVVTGQRLESDRAVLACRVLEPDQWCRRCGCEGAPRDTVTRQLAHEPLGWRPTTLLVTIPNRSSASREPSAAVRGHEKVPTGGQVAVPSGGQQKSPLFVVS
jgi:hypothetical protein